MKNTAPNTAIRDRQHPHQAGVLQEDTVDGCCLEQVDDGERHQDRGQQLHAGDANIAAGRIQAQRPSLHPVGKEEGDVGHAGREIAAAEAGGRGNQQHQPERRVGLAHKVGERERRNEQDRGTEDGPVAAAEGRHREGVGKAHQRADQPGHCDELEQLVGGVVEARLRQLGGDDAPDQPDREADMLGHDRPDQVASRDSLASRIPERLIFGAPFGNPRRILRHYIIPSRLTAASLQALPPATEARSEASPRWRVAMLIDDVEGRRRWRRGWCFNFRANCAHSGNAGNSEACSYCFKFLHDYFARKFCDSLNPCAAHKD
ncbi:hypothetical protein ACVWWR_005730 [Bradyrhizobium sp. LM3.2]